MFKIVMLSTAFLLVVACLAYAKTDHREYKDQKKNQCQECHKAAGVMPNHGVFFSEGSPIFGATGEQQLRGLPSAIILHRLP